MKTCSLFISLIFLFLSHIQISAQAPIGVATPANQTICSDEAIMDIVLSTSNGMDGSTTYTWTRDNVVNVTGIASSGTGNITGTLINQSELPQLVTFTITPTSNEIDGDAFAATVTINPITFPNVIIGADPSSNICDETEVTFNADVSNAGLTPTYQWQINGINVGTSNSYTTSELSNADQINLLVTADATCPGTTTSNSITMTVNPLIIPSVSIIASENPSCEGSDVTFSTDLEFNAGISPNYQWHLNGSPIPGANDQEYTFNTLIEGDEIWVVMNSNLPCAINPATSNSIIVIVNAGPTVDAGGNQAICGGSTVTLAGTFGGGATTATWTGGAGTFIPDRNTLNATYAPTAAEITARSVTLTLTTNDPDGPCVPVSESMTISISQPVVITSQPYNVGVCVSYPASLSIVATGDDLTYQWYRGTPPSGTPITNTANISGATSATLNFSQAELTDAGSYYVVVSGGAGCDPVISNVVTLNVSEMITVEQQPLSQTLCAGENVTFSVDARPYGQLIFQWYREGEIIVGATTPDYTITNAQPDDTGIYDVVISGIAGYYCDEVRSAPAELTVDEETISLTSGVGSDNQLICINTSMPNITYQIGGVAAGATITGLPSTLSGVYNPSTGIFTISGTPTTAETIDYTITTIGPCTHVTATGSITVNPLPTADAGPDQEICFGESIMLTATGGISYVWDNEVTNGIPFTPTTTTDYNVIVTNDIGCSDQDQVRVVVKPVSQTPTITFISDTLFSDSDLGNQWYVDGNLIADAVDSYYKPTITGTYYSIVTEDGCESEKSNDIYVQISGLEQYENSVLKVYPNPTHDLLTIETKELTQYTLEINSMSGQLMHSKEVYDKIYQINITPFPAGEYLITVWSKDYRTSKKILKY